MGRKKLHIGSHNLNGGGLTKLSHIDLVLEIQKYDVYCIQECWLSNDIDTSNISIPGYKFYRSLRPKGKRKRIYGGCLVFYREEYENRYITKHESRYEDFLWVSFNNKYFDIPDNLYMCCVYIPHEHSVFHEERGTDPYKILAEETANYQSKGSILLMGDFNSRVGTIQENWEHSNNEMQPIADRYIEIGNSLPKRWNSDKVHNNFGKKLINLCETLGLSILNGRVIGEDSGRLTYIGSGGSSTIDYAICSLNIYKYIQSLLVEDLPWYSDHRPLSLIFKRGELHDYIRIPQEPDNTPVYPLEKYVWNDDSAELFKIKMSETETLHKIEDLAASLDSLNNNDSAHAVTQILKDVADSTCQRKCLSNQK